MNCWWSRCSSLILHRRSPTDFLNKDLEILCDKGVQGSNWAATLRGTSTINEISGSHGGEFEDLFNHQRTVTWH
jgi:hypothetical protein